VHGEANLLEVVFALGPGGGLADLLDGGQEQTDQDGDDGDDDEQLDQRERPADDGGHRSVHLGHTTSSNRDTKLNHSSPLSIAEREKTNGRPDTRLARHTVAIRL
jgi:hypothetical protein